MLSDYYTVDSQEMYAEYLRSGSGIGYENWLYEINRYIFRTVSEVIHKTDNTLAVGIMVEDMWANSSANEQGSETNDTKQALYDGHCDTKKYIESGYADFVVVKAYGSTEGTDLNFDKVVSWWYDLAEKNNIKIYVCHLNEKIGDSWNEDQLLRQLTLMSESYSDIGGSVFNSFSSLKANPLSSTDTLMKYFNEEINTDTVFEDLEMISPAYLSFLTYDPTVKFMGTFDENFDVYFDGNKIKLNEAGNFYIQKELDIGWNYFTIEHKGKSYNYSIERRVDVLSDIEYVGDVSVDGGSKIALVAIAYSGSNVCASVGGQIVNLTEKGSSEGVDANGSYSKYVGYYTVGAGIVGQKQYLGEISFYANYNGIEEYMYGGTVTVNAEPEPPKEDIVVDMDPEQTTAGDGEIVGRIDPIVSDTETVTYVKVLNNNTDVLDAKTTGSVPSPEFSQMPAGTLDYYKSSSDGYITTTSGKRYRSYYVTTFDDTGLGYNALNVKAIGNSGGRSFITLGLDYKSSFNITTSISYVEGYEGPYGVTEFDAQYVYITFDNVTSVTSLPSFDNCSLFSAGEWEVVTENGVPKFRLVLTLRQAGIYSGVSEYYDSNGDLQIVFPIPTASLAGKTIVIDPGHGWSEDGLFDPGAIGEVTEQSINLAVAKKLEAKLTEMGANAVRLKTEDVYIYDRDRPIVAREYDADMFLSLHCNSSVRSEPHGCEVYYFTPWSQTLAKAINDNLASCYYDIYGDGTTSSRGDKYSYYWYTLEQGFPSVLVEMGFVSNERECLMMANSANQDKMATAIANGISEYFARSYL